jgi:hypothetical protein
MIMTSSSAIDKAAIRAVMKKYKTHKAPAKGCGYDLLIDIHGRQYIAEVKGTAKSYENGHKVDIIFSQKEVEMMDTPNWILIRVFEANTRHPDIQMFTADDLRISSYVEKRYRGKLR